MAEANCFGCRKKGHLIANCPEIKASANNDADEDSDGNDESSEAIVPAKKKHSKKKKGNHCRMVAWVSTTPNQYLLALDNCAYSSVVCNSDYVVDIVRGQCEPLLNWNLEAHSNEASGFIHPFGYCEINRNAPINLISEYCVRENFRVVEKFLDGKVGGNPSSKVVHVGQNEIEFRLDSDTRQYVVDWRTFQNKFSFSPKPQSVNVVISSVKQTKPDSPRTRFEEPN